MKKPSAPMSDKISKTPNVIILFLTKDWKEEWNGDNQLWDKNATECQVKTYPKFNSAIIFETNGISWHGVPDKIMCPEGIFRKSLAYYYISPLKTIVNLSSSDLKSFCLVSITKPDIGWSQITEVKPLFLIAAVQLK